MKEKKICPSCNKEVDNLYLCRCKEEFCRDCLRDHVQDCIDCITIYGAFHGK